jgi:hypothetical protein
MKATSQKRYPWLISLLATLGMIVLTLASLVVYTRVSDDRSPFGLAGLAYGIAGLLFMGLATLAYTLFRHSRKRVVGALNASLYWHISFGTVALFLIFLHSFGNFEQVSGTYALYALIALVISGIIGRTLDHFLPRLIARSVSAVLTEQGDDRIESVTRRLQDITTYQKEQVHSFTSQPALLVASRDMQTATNRPINRNIQTVTNHLVSRDSTALPTSWDLAHILQEKIPQEIERDATHHRFVPNRKSALSEPQALMQGLKERMEELHGVQQALQRERFYRAVIRYWRVFHICLALLTVGLTLWHLEFAATILYPIWFYH